MRSVWFGIRDMPKEQFEEAGALGEVPQREEDREIAKRDLEKE